MTKKELNACIMISQLYRNSVMENWIIAGVILLVVLLIAAIMLEILRDKE